MGWFLDRTDGKHYEKKHVLSCVLHICLSACVYRLGFEQVVGVTFFPTPLCSEAHQVDKMTKKILALPFQIRRGAVWGIWRCECEQMSQVSG